jgi:transposase InsO family protein
MKQKTTKQRSVYRMADDRWLVPLIRKLVDQRPTYGYRRIQVLLNRKLKPQGKPGVNHKRVYRIMKQNNMLLSRYTGKRPMRAHNGMVITLRRNMRWCSDVFEIACSNAQIVRVAFSLDCCDRELISFVASTGGISSAMICDLMIQSVEHRFGSVERVPHTIEWLSDNGSCYTAKQTRDFAGQLALVCCTTPVSSPESNGMAEAFIKTFKRDYVYINQRPDAQTVMTQLPHWFDDYNEVHPHKGLNMMSPREFIRSCSTQ